MCSHELFVFHLYLPQICSVGALLNLLGPSLSEGETEALCSILSDGMVLGAVQSCVFHGES